MYKITKKTTSIKKSSFFNILCLIIKVEKVKLSTFLVCKKNYLNTYSDIFPFLFKIGEILLYNKDVTSDVTNVLTKLKGSTENTINVK